MSGDGSQRAPQDDIDLEPPFRREVEMAYARLDEDDHYQILGVARTADKKMIKSAFYALASKFHTDRYFGKRLGGYKPRMEAIFNRVNIAHETLTNTQRRADYDQYVKELDRVRAFEHELQVDEHALEPIEEAPIAPQSVRSISQPRMAAVQAPTTPPQDPAHVERARREALARRLSGGSTARMKAMPGSTPHMPAVSGSAPRMAAVTPVTPAPPAARPPSTAPAGIARPLEAIVAKARSAAAAGDFPTAAAQMRHAARVDPAYVAEADTFARRALVSMAGKYIQQAREDEAMQRWLPAALSWSRAFEGRPDDGELAERAANAMRRAGADLHKAVRLAETAVRLRPNDASPRYTLVEVYLDAGLLLRAKSELANAMKLAPRDPRATELAAKLR